MQNVWRTKLLVMTLLYALVSPLCAQEEDPAVTPDAGGALYIALQPAFVVNYGGVGQLKYLKAELSVRVQNNDAANAVRHHMPYIRNNLVLLLSSQTDETLETQLGKENLRQAALLEVRAVLEQENGSSGVVDLYFNNFILQR